MNLLRPLVAEISKANSYCTMNEKRSFRHIWISLNLLQEVIYRYPRAPPCVQVDDLFLGGGLIHELPVRMLPAQHLSKCEALSYIQLLIIGALDISLIARRA